MDYKGEVAKLLDMYRVNMSSERSAHILAEAIDKCDAWKRSGGGEDAIVNKAQILSELAFEENAPQKRRKRWENALKLIGSQWQIAASSKLAYTYSSLAVDCFKDKLSNVEIEFSKKILMTANKYLGETIRQSSSPKIKSNLLVRKSSVLRHISILEFSKHYRLRRLQTSWRCANRANIEYRMPATILELGLSEWALARYEEISNKEYLERLKTAEEHFKDAVAAKFEPAWLALSRFYRMTFRPLDACNSFPRSVTQIKHIRRMLRESYIYSEAAIQLWYGRYPKELVNDHLSESLGILELANTAGYDNARIITNLSFERAILQGPEMGNTSFNDICSKKGDVFWDQAERIVSDANKSDLISYALALGINQGAVWTKLGTYARDFLKNQTLSEGCYQYAVRLNPRDPVALTNLARFLISQGEQSSLDEARRYLQQAESSSDRRFRWWRVVLAELEETEKEFNQKRKEQAKRQKRIPIKIPKFTNDKDIKGLIRVAESLTDTRQRGYCLEMAIYEIAKLTLGMGAEYEIEHREPNIPSISGNLIFKADKYKVKCKWKKTKTNHKDLNIFFDKLEEEGNPGIFISMSDFDDSVSEVAEEFGEKQKIILINGYEARSIIFCRINFDDLLTRKCSYVNQYPQAYFQVSPDLEYA